MNSALPRKLLQKPAFQLLGRISFSLCFVHGRLLFALAHISGARLPILAHFALYLTASLAVAWLFYLWIEEPFLRLSRLVVVPGERRPIPALSRLDFA